jgi:hypothetical protein
MHFEEEVITVRNGSDPDAWVALNTLSTLALTEHHA